MRANLSLIMNGKTIIKMSAAHLPFHTPARGDRAWKIMNEETGEVIDSHSPRTASRTARQTPWRGSWAEAMRCKGAT